MTDLAFQQPMLPLHRTAKCLVTLSAHLRADYFVGTEASPNAWKVYRDVAAQGDCFYDCVTRAHNSAQANPGALLSLGELRQRISGSLDEGDFEARVDFYVAMAASEADASLYQSCTGLLDLQALMTSSDHYASMADLVSVYRDRELNLIPIVVNSMYGHKRLVQQGDWSATPALMPYPADMGRYYAQPPCERRYVLLYKKGEHFELVVNTECCMAQDRLEELAALTAHAGLKGREHAYKAVFTEAQLPPLVLAAFQAQMM